MQNAASKSLARSSGVLLAAALSFVSPLASQTQSLYVANENTNTVTEFNAATGQTVPAFHRAGATPLLAAAPAGRWLGDVASDQPAAACLATRTRTPPRRGCVHLTTSGG